MNRLVLVLTWVAMLHLSGCMAPPREKISAWEQRVNTALPPGITEAEIQSFLERHSLKPCYFKNPRAISTIIKFRPSFPFERWLVITFYVNAEDQLSAIGYNSGVTGP